MTPLSDERQVARQLRRPRPAKPARFRRDRSGDYPIGYLAQLARPFLSRKATDDRKPATLTTRPPEAAAR
ncbi:MAG TPA: hypothetical protein VEJ23_06480 [Solirubrobacteraceae bacterium]|nr:hypothetical protein [Solirubrobacteraceae bacterium]